MENALLTLKNGPCPMAQMAAVLDTALMKIGLRLLHNSHTPIQVQITDRIGTLIRTGKLKPGALLPSVREAGGDWGVNFSTVSRSYADLQIQGLIVRNKSRRMEVVAVETMTRLDRAAQLRPSILGLKAKARELGLSDVELHNELIETLGMAVVPG